MSVKYCDEEIENLRKRFDDGFLPVWTYFFITRIADIQNVPKEF